MAEERVLTMLLCAMASYMVDDTEHNRKLLERRLAKVIKSLREEKE